MCRAVKSYKMYQHVWLNNSMWVKAALKRRPVNAPDITGRSRQWSHAALCARAGGVGGDTWARLFHLALPRTTEAHNTAVCRRCKDGRSPLPGTHQGFYPAESVPLPPPPPPGGAPPSPPVSRAGRLPPRHAACAREDGRYVTTCCWPSVRSEGDSGGAGEGGSCNAVQLHNYIITKI